MEKSRAVVRVLAKGLGIFQSATNQMGRIALPGQEIQTPE
jgi:hypothetical protein